MIVDITFTVRKSLLSLLFAPQVLNGSQYIESTQRDPCWHSHAFSSLLAEISPSQSTTHHDVATSSGLCDTQTHRFSRRQNVEDDSICVSVVSDSLSLHLSHFIQHKHLSNLSRDHASLQRSGTWGVVQQEFHPTYVDTTVGV